MKYACFASLVASLVAIACQSTTMANPCAPTQPIGGSGNLEIQRSDGTSDYALPTVDIEDFLNGTTLEVHASQADAGAGNVTPSDIVALVHIAPASDDPGDYPLASLQAEVAYCPTATMAIVVDDATSAIKGCRDDANPSAALVNAITEPLSGNLHVTSSQDKDLEAPLASGGHVSLRAQYSAGAQVCPTT